MRIATFVLLSAMIFCMAQAVPLKDKTAEDEIAVMEKLEEAEKPTEKPIEKPEVTEATTTTIKKESDDEIDTTTTEKHEVEFEKDEPVEDKKEKEEKDVKEVKEVKEDKEDKEEKEDKEDKEEKEEKEDKEVKKEKRTIDNVPIKRTIEELSEPLNVTQWGQNPCENNRNFNYYIPYPNDTSRYIQCDPWGTGTIKHCAKDLVWNTWALQCDEPSHIRNSTLVLPHRVFNCSLSDQQCLNGGVCTESSLGGDRCVCKPEWTGPACETRVDTSDLTHEILNGTFAIDKFRARIAALNISTDVAEYVRYKDVLDATTYAELHKYLALYKGTEVRYDSLLNALVESILDDIYPDAAFLSNFNATAVSVVELVQLIPNLMSYSKYSLERYQDVFAKYQQVLTSLVAYLNGTHNPLPSLRREAVQYTQLTTVFMNATMNAENSNRTEQPAGIFATDANRHLSEAQVRESLRAQFGATLNVTQRLFAGLERFQSDVAALVQNNTRDVFALTLAQCKLNGTAEVTEMLTQIVTSGQRIWDSLVNYGFWFVTSVYGGIVEQKRI